MYNDFGYEAWFMYFSNAEAGGSKWKMFAVVFRSDKKVTSYNDTKIHRVIKN